MRTLTVIFLSVMTFWNSSFETRAQGKEQKEETEIKAALDAHQYVFMANTAIPTGGRSRQLTGDYDLKILNDSLVSFLPYFGRAYTAPIGGGPGALDFTSTQFSYDVKEQQKGGWEIRIKPTDNREVQLLLLSVSKAGYASLQVSSNNRQPISFNGYVKGINK